MSQTEMEIKQLPIDKLENFEDNVNQMPGTTFRRLKESIETEGILQPLVVREKGDNYVILDGNHRYLASKQLEKETLPCKVLPEDDDRSNLRLNMQFNEFRGQTDFSAMTGAISRKIEKGKDIQDIADELNLYHNEVLRYYSTRECPLSKEELVEEQEDICILPLILSEHNAQIIAEAFTGIDKKMKKKKGTKEIGEDRTLLTDHLFIGENLGRFLTKQLLDWQDGKGNERIKDELTKVFLDNFRAMDKDYNGNFAKLHFSQDSLLDYLREKDSSLLQLKQKKMMDIYHKAREYVNKNLTSKEEDGAKKVLAKIKKLFDEETKGNIHHNNLED